MKKMWIVVADERRAMLYLSGALREPFALLQTIENDGDAPDRELETDRPGRKFSSATGQRHATDGERSTRRTRQEGFARRVADEIERARKAGKFDRLVLMCGARMLGLLREAMSTQTRELVLVEVPKDMAKHDEPAIRAHVPQETWRELGR
ncbi:MAG TPA: host attachment protein [Gammaproteobacteria bacterium]|nr:host attachment protein [Gammaproteobacteria bacterium]